MAVSSLGVLVTDLRLELGQSSNPATGTNMRDQLVYRLNRAQEELANDYEWPVLQVDRDIPIAVGARYYAYPTDMPFENISHAFFVWNMLHGELIYGITPAQLALWNSNVGMMSWPVERWRHDPDRGLFEVWPVPSQAPAATATSQAPLVRFRGTRLVPRMLQDSDVCVLPDTLIVMFAAAEMLARQGAKEAGLQLSRANNLLRRFKLRQTSKKARPFVLGGGSVDGSERPGRIGLDYIPTGYGSGPGR